MQHTLIQLDKDKEPHPIRLFRELHLLVTVIDPTQPGPDVLQQGLLLLHDDVNESVDYQQPLSHIYYLIDHLNG